jgi:hypothetical protein
VRDILLSRRHLRLQPSDDGWMVQDLQSKNGTVLNGEQVRSSKVLKDNDVVRIGKSKIIFHAGLPDEDFADEVLAPTRPATPGDSLAGTLSGFTLLLPGESEVSEDMPNPQPRPKDPAAYKNQELQTLLSAIASSSWDSVYAEARQPLRGGQGFEAEEEVKERRRVRPSSPTDFSLQASPVAAVPPPAVAVAVAKPRRKFSFQPTLHAGVAAVWICLLVLLNLSHKPIAGAQAAPTAPAVPPSDAFLVDDSDSQIAVDQEPSDVSPKPQSAQPPLHFNIAAAKQAAIISSGYIPWIW